MGCDIHSMAEMRDPDTGAWQKIGNLFPYQFGMRNTRVTEEVLNRIPESHRDGYMLDLLRWGITHRDVDQSEYWAGYFPEIAPDSPLATKIINSANRLSDIVERGREDRDWVQQRYGRKGVKGDPDAWHQMIHETMRILGDEADLSAEEREVLRTAILNYRDTEWDEDDDERYMSLSFNRLHGPGWLKAYRDGREDGPMYLDEAFPYFDADLAMHDEPLDGRNYRLFAILADVRNGRGFAGSDTGKPVRPISDPRGIPDDASPEYKALVEHWDCDGHSHSYHTISQLKAYDWDGMMTHRGIVPAVSYEDMKARGHLEDDTVGPRGSIAAGISGASIVTFSPEGYEEWVRRGCPAMKQDHGTFSRDPIADVGDIPAAVGESKADSIVKLLGGPRVSNDPFDRGGRAINGVLPYVKIAWSEPKRQNAGTEFWDSLAALERFAKAASLSEDDIRIVFFFDN